MLSGSLAMNLVLTNDWHQMCKARGEIHGRGSRWVWMRVKVGMRRQTWMRMRLWMQARICMHVQGKDVGVNVGADTDVGAEVGVEASAATGADAFRR